MAYNYYASVRRYRKPYYPLNRVSTWGTKFAATARNRFKRFKKPFKKTTYRPFKKTSYRFKSYGRNRRR